MSPAEMPSMIAALHIGTSLSKAASRQHQAADKCCQQHMHSRRRLLAMQLTPTASVPEAFHNTIAAVKPHTCTVGSFGARMQVFSFLLLHKLCWCWCESSVWRHLCLSVVASS